MAQKVNWTYEATADLEALAEYISRDSAFYASAFVQEIRDAVVHSTNFLREDVLFLRLAIRKFVNFL